MNLNHELESRIHERIPDGEYVKSSEEIELKTVCKLSK